MALLVGATIWVITLGKLAFLTMWVALEKSTNGLLHIAFVCDWLLRGAFAGITGVFALFWALIAGFFTFMFARTAYVFYDELFAVNPFWGDTWSALGVAFFSGGAAVAAGMTIWCVAKFLPGDHHELMYQR